MFHQVVFNGKVQILCLLGSQMTNRAVNQLQTCLYGPFADFLDGLRIADSLDVFIGTEFQVNLIGVMDGFLGECLSNQIGKISADVA